MMLIHRIVEEVSARTKKEVVTTKFVDTTMGGRSEGDFDMLTSASSGYETISTMNTTCDSTSS